VADERREQPRPPVQATQVLDPGHPGHSVADGKTSLSSVAPFSSAADPRHSAKSV
jgi:hypothetical protein